MSKCNSLFQDQQEKAAYDEYEQYLIDQKAAVQDGYTSVYAPMSFEDWYDHMILLQHTRDLGVKNG